MKININKIVLFLFFVISGTGCGGDNAGDNNSTQEVTPVNTDTDADGILNVDDQWPNDNTKPVLSTLWGAYGEQWSAAGRLPFVGMAGYRDGAPIPDITRIVVDVIDFGATNTEGSANDTQAFLDAIADAKTKVSIDNPGVIYVPDGVYDIDKQLHLSSGIVLRGEGRDTTKLRFTTGVINDVTALGNDTRRRKLIVLGGGKNSNGDLKTGLDWQQYNSNYSAPLDTMNLPVRGDFSLRLASPLSSGLKQRIIDQGYRIRLGQIMNYGETSSTPMLASSVYGGSDFSPAGGNGGIVMTQQFVVTIESDNQTLTLDRPLRFSPSDELSYGSSVRIATRESTTAWEAQEIGVEKLSVILPSTDWDANGNSHYGVFGQGGIDILSDNSWVREVRIVNADNGIEIDKNTFNNTIENIIISADRGSRRSGPVEWRYDSYGHHGISIKGRSHLLKDFMLEVDFVHNITMNNAHGCVVSGGESPMTNMDHHRQGIYDSVWTEINLHDARRMWNSTGNPSEGFNAAAYNTYWNVVSDNPQEAVWPEDGSGSYPQWGYHKINIVATDIKSKPAEGEGNRPYPYHPDNAHLETMKTSEVWPKNIYEAQKKAYLDGKLW